MAGNTFRLLVIISLALSQLISLNAARVGDFKHQHDQIHQAPQDKIMDLTEKNFNGVNGRMLVELNDYPGSGANNRHVPRPPFGRGCIDC